MFIPGGPKAYKVHEIPRSPYALAFHWIEGEPCLVVYLKKHPSRAQFALKQGNAWRYADSEGYATMDLALTCMNIATHLGQDMQSAKKLGNVILDYLEDLVRMPPEPPWEDDKVEIGEMAIKVDGETVYEGAVHDE